jgi:transcriptional regulator with XRE-family HTH domain
MAAPLDLDPASSVLAYFGSELRRYRGAAGLSQERLGEIVNYTGALIGMIETAKRTPTRDFAERCDAALETSGALSRLWPLVNRTNFPNWFRDYVELEPLARKIQTFEVQAVPGLLQTEAYARAVLGAGRSTAVDELAMARLARQRILERPSPPQLWVVLDEAAVRRPVGGQQVMRAQLARLVELAIAQRIVLQVLPYAAGEHACMDGALSILSLSDGQELVYVEAHGSGHIIDETEAVHAAQLRYDLVRASALAPAASVELLRVQMRDT